MRPHRREFLKTMTAPALAPLAGPAAGQALSGYQPGNTYDVAVVGAGVFGSWTAHHLLKAGKKVLLIDEYGASNSRASSGGESRIIRMGYGADEIYTRSSQRALELWKEFFQRTGNPLFHQAGVLWLARGNDSRIPKTAETLARAGVKFEKLSQSELEKRFPQINFSGIAGGVYEPESGALLARRAVQAVVEDFIDQGGHFLPEPVMAPSASSGTVMISTRSGERISAGAFVFACGPWLPKVFPALLGKRIFPTRQDVFFFAVPPGDRRWTPPAMPAWIDVDVELYGIPDLENRGFKIANDHHGPPFDPDSSDRFVTREQIAEMRRRLGQLFPGLKDAPLVESRVCQYENSSNGDFLVDAHPDMKNVWLVGAGSGHGFKHGPALGEYVAAQVLGTGRPPEPRYSLRSKDTVQKRSVF
jgi:monomeric sarcosine oxidase